MNDKEKDNSKNTNSEEKNSANLPRGYGLNMLYFLFLFFILLTIFNWPSTKPKEISWLAFEQTMLSAHDVTKIVVVNKEFVEIYIKEEKLNEAKYKDLSQGSLISKLGPHYTIQIGSVERFESK